MTHREIVELLPWYVNGSLAEAERREVAEHLPGCGECAREIGELRAIEGAVRDAGASDAEPSPFARTRALAAIDALARARAVAPGWLRWWRQVPALARVALAVQLVAIAGLATYVATSREDRSYATAASGAGDLARARLAVGFQPGATEERIREALREIGASIVGGPSALGLYAVELPVAPGDAPGVERALASLRARGDVVRVAERTP